MRKISVIVFAFAMALSLFAKAQDKVTLYIPVKAGHEQLVNGEVKISLPEAFTNYYVVLTPSVAVKNLYIADKQKEFFIVKGNAQDKGAAVSFDYMIFSEKIKETKVPNKQLAPKKTE